MSDRDRYMIGQTLRRLNYPLVIGLFSFSIFLGFVITSVVERHTVPSEQFQPTVSKLHSNYPSTSVFDQALNTNKTLIVTNDRPILGMVVNHHLLAADFIADTINQAPGQNIDRIILLSPNHFYAGRGNFITTKATFTTPYGDVASDRTFVSNLTTNGAAVDNAEAFIQEHGVYNILPFINKQFPSVPMVPIIIRDGVSAEQIDQLRTALGEQISARTLIIASLDFAHNQTNDGAKELDGRSMAWLQTVDPAAVQPNSDSAVAVDSPMTLKLFLGLMRDRSATDFTLLHSSNSALKTGRLDATNVTSYITGLFRIPPEN